MLMFNDVQMALIRFNWINWACVYAVEMFPFIFCALLSVIKKLASIKNCCKSTTSVVVSICDGSSASFFRMITEKMIWFNCDSYIHLYSWCVGILLTSYSAAARWVSAFAFNTYDLTNEIATKMYFPDKKV